MALVYINFITDYEDVSNKSFQFEEQNTIESILLAFLRANNSKIILDLEKIVFLYKSKFLNSNSYLNKQLRDIFKKEIITKIPIKIKVIDTGNILGRYPIDDTFIKFDDYKYIFVSLHKKLSEFFDEKYSNLKYDNAYKNNFINFIESMNIDKKNQIINFVNRIDSGSVKEFIMAYVGETPLCYSLNKWLRKCDKNIYEKIKYFAGPFSYCLYKYANDEPKVKINFSKKFFRKMVLKSEDYEKYKKNIGELICYPAFTSTSENNISKYNYPNSMAIEINNLTIDDIYVILIIDYKCNNSSYPTPCINVSFPSEEKEYIFPPFSFFRIENVENKSGKNYDPHIIYMSVPNKRILIEFAIKNNQTIYYDKNLNELYSS